MLYFPRPLSSTVLTLLIPSDFYFLKLFTHFGIVFSEVPGFLFAKLVDDQSFYLPFPSVLFSLHYRKFDMHHLERREGHLPSVILATLLFFKSPMQSNPGTTVSKVWASTEAHHRFHNRIQAIW